MFRWRKRRPIPCLPQRLSLYPSGCGNGQPPAGNKRCRQREIAAIGFHGQTCDHFPPSAAGGSEPYTLQVGDPRLLADLTGIPVIYDFRSDDLMNGGEGAPLAPLHNRRIARMMQKQRL